MHVDIDYYKADVVKVNNVTEDLGEPLTYHPEIPPLDSFSTMVNVSQDVSINSTFPAVNFNNWETNFNEKHIKSFSS